MKKKLAWFAVFLIAYTITGIAAQYFKGGTINSDYLSAVVVGVSIACLIEIAPKNPIMFKIRAVFITLGLPIVLVGIVSFVFSLFSIPLVGKNALAVYLVGIVITLYLLKRVGIRRFYQDILLDERSMHHYAWSGFLSFIFINLLLVAALLQPWIAYSQLGLWVGILIAAQLFWLAMLLFLEVNQ